jgi:hypothetical protein
MRQEEQEKIRMNKMQSSVQKCKQDTCKNFQQGTEQVARKQNR